MPPVSRRCLASCLLVSAMLACKPRSETADSAVLAGEDGVAGGGTSLKGFDYQVMFRTLPALAGRLGSQGCQEAANWLVGPKSRDLPRAVGAILQSDKVYETAVANVLDPHWAFATCRDSETSQRTDGIAMKLLADAVTAKGYGLTVIVLGGVGSMFTPDGPIAEARAEWAKLANVQVANLSLTQTGDLEESAKRLGGEWDRLVSQGGSTRRYLVWAHDVAGNVALDVLAQNDDIRNKTLALVTVGSPIGGVVKTVFAENLKREVGNVTATISQLVPSSVTASLDKFGATVAAIASLSPEARRAHLASRIKNASFGRANDDGFGEKTKVFHVASAIDPANMTPLPLASLRGGKLVAAMSTRQTEQALLVPFLASLKDEPLGDGMVALPNAVVPKAYVPAGMETALVAVTTLDHFALQLTRRADEKPENVPPYAKIVDAIVETVAQSLGSYVERGDPDGHETGAETICGKRPTHLDERWECRAPCEWVCYSCEAEGPDPVEKCR